MLATARDLGLGALVETHSDEDLDKVLATDAEVVGVNARDLETLEVDVDRALTHLARIRVGRISVMESGIATRAHVRGRRGCRRVCHPGGRSADARRGSRCQAPGAAWRGELTMSAVAERTIVGPRRPRPVRHLRGTVRPRGPDPGPGRARRPHGRSSATIPGSARSSATCSVTSSGVPRRSRMRAGCPRSSATRSG